VHNTQPWTWRLGPRSVHLFVDRSRWLPATDPDGIPAAATAAPRSGNPAMSRFAGVVPGHVPGGPDGATLLVLGTTSDDTLSWLRAGEATSAVLLQATVAGLASSPLSQPLEVGHTRLALRDGVLAGTLSPQLILRVGWASGGSASTAIPRRGLAETIGPPL
jgi:hypothetical protein